MVFHRPRWHTNNRFQGDGLFMTDASFPRTFEKFDAKGSPLKASGRDGIWLLDDDASMLRALGRLLNSAGFTVEKFSNPADFLSELQQRECRVAVLDVWMPDMNGLEVQACLRRDSPRRGLFSLLGATIHQSAKPHWMPEPLASSQNHSRTKFWCNSFTRLRQSKR